MPHDIAIVGASCRFPGARNLQEYWSLLSQSRSAITEVPAWRWSTDQFYDPDPAVPGKANTKWGGFIEQPGAFDNEFFNTSIEEAIHVDPQQRLILELAWEALEDAGIAPTALKGTRTGVYVGISHNDYERIIYRDYRRITRHHGTGSYQSVAASRLSYFLNIVGPSITVDTACSSALTALHTACLALRCENLPLALVGAVTLHLTPDETIGLTKGRMLSGSGQCRSFDKKADGYVRGEGGGILVLKRLADARRNNDRIYAVVKGTAVNHNGRSNGLSAPSGPALRAVMEQGLESAGLCAEQVSLLEAHGTATSLGDQIELRAVREIYDHAAAQPLWLGCVKTNIGHLETASGMASLIKVMLAMAHGTIPANLNFTGTADALAGPTSRLRVPTVPTQWTRGSSARIAAVTAYGFGGANGHVVLVEPELNDPRNEESPIEHVLCLSARDATALCELLAQYDEFLHGTNASLGDICYTANAGRAHFDWRVAFVAASLTDLRRQVRERLDQGVGDGRPAKIRRLVFHCCDNFPAASDDTTAWLMRHPAFRHAFEAGQKLFEQSLPGVNDARIQHYFTRLPGRDTASFVLQYAVAEFLIALGIVPAGLQGTGRGRLVAAMLAGMFSALSAGSASGAPASSLCFRQPTRPLLDHAGNPVPLDIGTNGTYLKLEDATALSLSVLSHDCIRISLGSEGNAKEYGHAARFECASRSEFLQALAFLYAGGVAIDWESFYRGSPYRTLSLPTYPFQRKQLWFELDEPRTAPAAEQHIARIANSY